MPGHRAEVPTDVRVVFHRAEWGCLDFDVSPLTGEWKVSATHICSPFGDMLRWLEAIVDSQEVCRWAIDCEGSYADFIYLAPPKLCITDASARLVLLHAFQKKPDEPIDVAVDRVALVRAFYESFRHYVVYEHAPEHWDYDEAAETWGGEVLRPMRSLVVEAFLRDADTEQPMLNLAFPWDR